MNKAKYKHPVLIEAVLELRFPSNDKWGMSSFFFAQLRGNSLTTYQSVPVIKISRNDDVFISPVKRSVTVNGSFIVGGRISEPEIDEDEVVYFDE